MNILFVNYGDFTSNSLNHIAGFANTLCGMGHACAVAVPEGKDTLSVIPEPKFIALTYAEALANPRFFPDGRPADIVHAWTPREGVRKFVLAYQRKVHARLIIHLEDNEDFLLAAWLKQPIESIGAMGEIELASKVASTLAHPRRYHHFLRTADGITVIVEALRRQAPPGIPCALLEPGVDFSKYRAQAPDPAYCRELGLPVDGKVLVFTGSITFANEPEVRELYEAVALLNERGYPTRLVRTGPSAPQFQASLSDSIRSFVMDLGFVDKGRLPDLLALADVLVQPGRPGPFNDLRLPSKLPEFLSAGRPVILPATNIGLDLRDGVDALLLKTGSVVEIADACTRVFGGPPLAHILGQNAVAFAHARFDLATNTRGLVDFYTAVQKTPERQGSTAAMTDKDTELSLVLRGMAAETKDAEAAKLARDLAPLVEALEHQDMVQAERARLDRELTDALRNYDVTRKQVVHFEGELALSQRHTDNLTRDLALSQQHTDNLTRDLALSQQHVFNLTRDLTSERKRLQLAEESLRLTRLHADNLENVRLSLQHRIRDLEAQSARLDRTISARDKAIDQRNDVIAQREAKIRTMEGSFSWRATLPLRYLRRKLVDRWRPQAPAPLSSPASIPSSSPAENSASAPTLESPAIYAPPAQPIRFNVDSPQSWNVRPGKMLIRGWCFTEEGRRISRIRAVLADRTITGTYGLRRPDVAATMGTQNGAELSGWQIALEVTPTDTQVVLEAGDENGQWNGFSRHELHVGDAAERTVIESYEQWVDAYDTWTIGDLQRQADQARALAFQPLISVLMPVYNTPEKWLRHAIDSVRAQTYPNWEFCIADDASTAGHVRLLLEKAAADDKRIKLIFRDQNGHIAEASNSALKLASGDYVALLDHDDELAPNALFEVATALQTNREAAYLYSDEDKIDEDGRRNTPYFKPDWLPDLFHGQNYTSHLSVFRTAAVRAVGGFRKGFEGSQDWDLALRVIEEATPDRIVHIPRILYHWRAIPGSTALVLSEKDYPIDAARRALAEHFSRQGQSVEILPVQGGHWRVRHPLPDQPPLVSLIIPTRNGILVLKRCVDSILERTTYPNFEVIVVDNGSDDPATLQYLGALADGTHPLLRPHHTARVLRYDGAFNYSAINNFAVNSAAGGLIGLLNNDLEVINPDWLDEMASQALRPEIGCVGAMLYYPNDTIQHAGCVLGIGGVAGHAFKTLPRGTEGIFNRARLVQNYSAVTAACLVVRKAVYEQVGGLDEKDLAIAFNDIDFCLKVRAAGFLNLWTPFAEFYHHESASRGADDTPEKAGRFKNEVEKMLERWGPVLQQDPAYNPNLTLENEHFSLSPAPRMPAS